MREIKFRAWDNDNEAWCDDFCIELSTGLLLCDHGTTMYVQEIILEQFTGLKDKNGVGQEIYDGDLIGTPNGIVCQVVYRELYGQWWTKFNNTSHKSQWDKPLFEVAGNSYLKVIGNIHETPADGRTN